MASSPSHVLSAVALAVVVACASEAPSEAPVVHRLDDVAGRLSLCLGLSSPSVVGYLGSTTIGGASEETKACLRRAKDCSSVLRCAGYEPGSCEAGCEGDTARNCFVLPNGLSVQARENCAQSAASNTSCALVVDEGKGNYAFCYDGASCSESHCDNNVGLFCDRSHRVAFPCDPEELCVSDGASTSCVRDERCERDHCDESGENLFLCDRGRIALEVRCDSVLPGTHCVRSVTGAGCEARAVDPACSAEPFRSFCDSSLAVACDHGVRYEIDCSNVEGHCVEQSGSATCRQN